VDVKRPEREGVARGARVELGSQMVYRGRGGKGRNFGVDLSYSTVKRAEETT